MRGSRLPGSRPGILLLALALLAVAAGDPAREALPPTGPKPAKPQGRVLFSDDFSDDLAKWTADRKGVWTIVRGMLRADLPDQKQERSLLYAGDEAWDRYAVDLDVCMMRGVDKGVVVHVIGETGVGVDLRGPGYQDVVMYRREWPMGRATAVNGNAIWHHLRIEARGDRYRVFVDGENKLERRISPRNGESPHGRIALAAYTGGVGQCTVYYDNVIVTALGEAARGAAAPRAGEARSE